MSNLERNQNYWMLEWIRQQEQEVIKEIQKKNNEQDNEDN